jgi:hypothetical protein
LDGSFKEDVHTRITFQKAHLLEYGPQKEEDAKKAWILSVLKRKLYFASVKSVFVVVINRCSVQNYVLVTAVASIFDPKLNR